MKKLVVIFGNGNFVNVDCDEMKSDENFIYGYLKEHLIAIFQIGTFDGAYLSRVKE